MIFLFLSDNLNVPTQYLFILSDGKKKMKNKRNGKYRRIIIMLAREAHGLSNANIPRISSSTSRHG